jgi:hypothetical protein
MRRRFTPVILRLAKRAEGSHRNADGLRKQRALLQRLGVAPRQQLRRASRFALRSLAVFAARDDTQGV